MEQYASFGYWLRRRRRQLDLTQGDLAQRAGCAAATIRKIEADERRPSRELAERLAECLAIPTDQRSLFHRAARAELAVDRLPTPQQDVPAAGAPPPLPAALHSYTLREQIGAGAYSVVYRAEQPEVGREVAIKIIGPPFVNQPAFIRRFEAEAQIVARLEHPNIVPLYDYWRAPDRACLVMRYLPGGSLRAALAAGPLPIERCTHLLDQIGPALASAHRRGVVHQDIKPANILLDDDSNAYLADFSIAKDLRASGEPVQPDLPYSSPRYLAPELLHDEPATPQSDLYSLGMLLYELLAGEALATPLPALAERRLDVPAALDMVLQRATATNPAARYRDCAELLAAWRQALAPLPAEAATPAVCPPPLVAPHNPYKGLRGFLEADAADFFGRTALVARLLERLAAAEDGGQELRVGERAAQHTANLQLPTANSRFLALVGPSGSGKSSVVRAGLLPALRRGGLPGSEHWFITTCEPGVQPFQALEAALLRVAMQPPAGLAEQLRADEHGLAHALASMLPADDATELVLVIDQFEELFTLTEDATTRAQFLASIVAAVCAPHSRLRVIVTLRADYYDCPLAYPAFGELMRTCTEVVLPLTPQELEQAIVEPAARVGVAFARDLVATIMQEVGSQPGALPLLQYALTELFEQCAGQEMTLAAYRAGGGVLRALAGRAEAIYTGLDASAQAAARQLFLRLIALGDQGDETRRRVSYGELAELSERQDPGTKHQAAGDHARFSAPGSTNAVIDAYCRARLLTLDRDPRTHSPTVEVAHEALLRVWGRLRGWIDAGRADVRMLRQLEQAAAQWRAASCDPSYLLSDARLAQFTGWAAHASLVLGEEARAFLAASSAHQSQAEALERTRAQHELALAQQLAATEQAAALLHRRTARRLHRRAWLLATALMLALVGVIASMVLARGNARLADQNAASAATAQAALSQSERLRLAGEANAALERGASRELAVLLAIRSLRYGYSPQADLALLQALARGIVVQRFVGHAGAVAGVALAPTGLHALTASADGTARLWELASGRELLVLRGHSGQVTSTTFAPDGHTALTGGSDGTARLWELASGRELLVLRGHSDTVSSVAIAPDGRTALSASFDGTVRLWELASGRELLVLRGHAGAVTGVAFAPDGQTCLTAGVDATARLWELASGQELLVLRGHTGAVTGVAFAPDGRTALTGSTDRSARLWELASGQELRRLIGHSDALSGPPSFAPNGRMVVTASFDKTARLWDVASGQELHRLVGHGDAITGVAFAPNGREILTGGAEGQALLWRVRAEVEPRVLATSSTVVSGVAIAPDGRTALIAGNGGQAEIWDVVDGRRLGALAGPGAELIGAAFAPDGTLALSSAGRQLVLWDVASGRQLRRFAGTTQLGSPAFAPDGRTVAAGDAMGTLWLWEAASGRELRRLTGHTDTVAGVAFAPDGGLLVSSSLDGTARLWDAPTGEPRAILRGHRGAVLAAAFAPDGRSVLTGGADWTLRLWDVAGGQELRVIHGHSDAVLAAAFAPDGRTVLSGSADGTVRLWDAASGQELRRLVGHTEAVTSVAFAPGGTQVLSGGADATARIWRADLAAVVDLACALLPHDLSPEERATYGIDATPSCPAFGGQARRAPPTRTARPPYK